ncbi:helix-turn-helix transcriptional regulator [Saccharibacillus sp. JS10]|uniref:helix-turn-helix domain-containing protein n=1 Tax=Saccharibacillus sp. JS10 TaxID=2950552 RepID=UPI00210B5F63|nr:helix-turn-helix transcriptional regulator [Saccharibacillus sp. JS10]MCQ4088073.1 helix-turn-helix transcriptional regulator [Saccharibacillus sp. JS10]
MEKSFKLRSTIEQEMARQGHNFATLSEKSGINRGVFSAILNSSPPKPISFHQLATITEALNMPPGWLFDEYMSECFYDEKPNRRRIEPFLLACAELGRTDLIHCVLKRLLEDLKYLPFVFETAECLFMSGKILQSISFYEVVAEHEKHQHSLRLCISRYRLFRARLGEDGEENLKLAVQFEPFREFLPISLKLDAQLRISNLYYELGKYTELEHMADEFFETALNRYNELRSPDFKDTEPDFKTIPDKSLLFYYGSALLLKQLSLIEQERYEEALPYSEMYGDLSDFEITDDDTKQEIENLKIFALGNSLHVELMLGNFDVLDRYIKYMDDFPNEALLCLVNVIRAANRHNVDIDSLIEERYVPLDIYLEEHPDGYYPLRITRSTFASLHYHLAVYYHRQGRREQSSAHVRACWKLSQEMNNQQHFRQLASLLSLPPKFVIQPYPAEKLQ